MPDHPTRWTPNPPATRGEVVPLEAYRARRREVEAPVTEVVSEDEYQGPAEWPPLPVRTACGLTAVTWAVCGLGALVSGGLWVGVYLVLAVILTAAVWAQT